MEMITKQELKEMFDDEKYYEMVSKVNIVDFTKCIAEFSGLEIDKVSKNAIKDYLYQWAVNKYPYFEFLGKQLKVDMPISYIDENKDIIAAYDEISKDYPSYYHWLSMFKNRKENKITSDGLNWSDRDTIVKFWPMVEIDGMLITRFFKNKLNAPDEVITKIATIYENREVEATQTISIDPVDMMLASENPYKWHSCYKLIPSEDSHADGCLAAILDSSSLITYIWNREGELNLYNDYTLKSVRYKRMRQWISIEPNFRAIHFNMIYPGKASYSKDFEKLIRKNIEDYTYNKMWSGTLYENIWKHNDRVEEGHYRVWFSCDRCYLYGYEEFNSYYIYYLRDAVGELTVSDKHWGAACSWDVYDNKPKCPCGCGNYLIGSDDYDEGRYDGSGFRYEAAHEETWCEYADDYCSCDDCNQWNCSECYHWQVNHPVCDLDEDEECENWEWSANDDGVINSNANKHCEGCPLYRFHHPEEFTNEPENPDEAYEQERLND